MDATRRRGWIVYVALLVTAALCTPGSAENEACGDEAIQLGATEPYILQSPSYPSDVTASLRCDWTLTAAVGAKVKVAVRDLHLSHYTDSFAVVERGAATRETNASSDVILEHYREGKGQIVMSSSHVVGVRLLLAFHCSDDFDSTCAGRRYWIEISQVSEDASLRSACRSLQGTYLCGDQGMCMSQDGRCDGVVDCLDQSDERDCLSCPANEYCANGSACLTWRYDCDGVADCASGEDETSCDVRHCPRDCSCSLLSDGHLVVNCTSNPNVTNVWGYLPRITVKVILKNNNMTNLEPRQFLNVPNLLHLNLEDNRLTRLKRGVFAGLRHLQLLKLNINNLNVMDPGVFKSLVSLIILRLDDNSLTHLTAEMFEGLNNLTNLRLGNNRIEKLEANTFRHLRNLLGLDLTENRITVIEPDAFSGLQHLRSIELRDNLLTVLQTDTFSHLKSLAVLTMEDNPWTVIKPGAFNGLTNLKILAVIRLQKDMKDFTVDKRELERMDNLQHFVVDDERMCCLLADRPNGIKDICITGGRQRDFTVSLPYFTCKRLMHNPVLRVFIWCLGVSALVGNAFIVAWRLRTTDSGKRSQSVLILNLAVSDFIMGLYMLIIAGADAHFRDSFFLHVAAWRSGHLCNLAGFLSMLSSEASVFFVTMISIDRFLCVVFPFGKKWLRLDSARVASMAMWCVALLISIPPLLLQDTIEGFYGLSDVCVGLPLIRSNSTSRTDGVALLGIESFNATVKESATPSRVFSVTVYLGINLVCCLVVLLCYLAIAFVVTVKLPSKKLQRRKDKEHRKKEMAMARRMLLIVGTDFCCWMPVILMGILSMGGAVDIPDSVYAWVVVFVIPINSSINPYLYTFSNTNAIALNCCQLRRPGAAVNSVKMKPLHSNDTKDVSQRCRSGTHTFL